MKHIFLLLFLLVPGFSISQVRDHTLPEWPALHTGDKPVCHLGYCLLYAEAHEQAAWVAYELTAEETIKAHERSNTFLEDPKINTGSATSADFAGSGYDRGHLAPAADMSWSRQAMEESFYFSNMSPQRPSFNRGIWKRGEEQVREWARHYGKLLVVTGPILKAGLPAIGPGKVSVPEYYFKVLLRPDSVHPAAIGFLIPNQGSAEELGTFVIPIDSIESISKLDFFPWLPDQTEARLESATCLKCWDWKKSNDSHSGSKVPSRILPANSENHSRENMAEGDNFRCHGITGKGSRCKRKVKVKGHNCYQHGG